MLHLCMSSWLCSGASSVQVAADFLASNPQPLHPNYDGAIDDSNDSMVKL